MRKILFFWAIFLVSFMNADGQISCETAVAITANGEITIPEITGEYGSYCWGGTNNSQNPSTPLKANWYKYTPTTNGQLYLSSYLQSNPDTVNTRLSVFTSLCDALQCYNGNDDVNAGLEIYASELSIPVESGITYYIAWDNNWSSGGFNFRTHFTQSDCLSPNELSLYNPTNITANSAVVSWNAAIGNPSAYDVAWGPVGFIPESEIGTTTIVYTTTTSATLSGLPTSETLNYCIRAHCSQGSGRWTRPIMLKLAVTAPYTFNFDTEGDNADGFTFDSWGLNTSASNAHFAHTGTAFIASGIRTTAPADAYAFFRPMSLTANEVITIAFRSLLIPAAATASMEVTVGMMPQGASQTTSVETFALTGTTAANNQPDNAANYAEHTATFTAPATGTYYFAFHNNSPISPVNGTLLVDTVDITSTTTGINENTASKLSIFPNPAINVINITNNDSIHISNVQIVDLNGRTIKSINFDGLSDVQINISDIANGLYMMTVSSDRGSITQKIIKN